jgi:hypothetical protein
MAGMRVGTDCVLLRNTGTYGTPIWDAIGNTQDVTVALTKNEASVKVRGTQWEQVRGTIKVGSIEWSMAYDGADTDWIALKDAFLAGTAVDLAAADGPIATSGTVYYRQVSEITAFGRKEPLEEFLGTDVTAKPAIGTNLPTWVTAP